MSTPSAKAVALRLWRALFPWRYDRRTARRYCKTCGTQQDLMQQGTRLFYETMGRGNAACGVNHG